jgi:hypothetical protein
MAQPLPVPGAKEVTESEAIGGLGGTIVLPDTPSVAPSDAGAFWMNQAHGETKSASQTTVVVTFPAQGLRISYERPAVINPLAYIQESVKEEPGSQLVWLGKVPAWLIPEPQDGSHPGVIQFVAAGATIQVDGNTDVASLQAVAQSIVDRASSAG